MTGRYDLSPEAYEGAFAAFVEAVRKAPGQVAFANLCRCTQGNVSQLLRAKSLLPERYVIKVELGTGVSRFRLRPDIYPAEPSSPPPFVGDHEGSVATGAPIVACDRVALLHRSAAR